MGLFDSIKDALTTDDAERYEAATKQLEKATADLEQVRAEVGTKADPASRNRVEKAEKEVAEARATTDELAAKAGVNQPNPAADAAAAQARAKADAQAAADAEAIRNVEAMKAKESAPEAAPAEAAPAPEVAPQVAPEAAAEPELRTYTVKKGDTLSEIGQQFGVKWREIAKLNNISNPDRIYPGQVFKIPNA